MKTVCNAWHTFRWFRWDDITKWFYSSICSSLNPLIYELKKITGRKISMFYPGGLPGLPDLFSLWSQSSENLSMFWPFLEWTSHQSHRWCSCPTNLKEEQYQRHLQPTDDDLVNSSITSELPSKQVYRWSSTNLCFAILGICVDHLPWHLEIRYRAMCYWFIYFFLLLPCLTHKNYSFG